MSPPKKNVKTKRNRFSLRACASALPGLAGPTFTQGMTSLETKMLAENLQHTVPDRLDLAKFVSEKNICETFWCVLYVICCWCYPWACWSPSNWTRPELQGQLWRSGCEWTQNDTFQDLRKRKQVLCYIKSFVDKRQEKVSHPFGHHHHTFPATMKLVLFLVLVSSSLLLLVNAEYRWDQDAQEWVLVEDVSWLAVYHYAISMENLHGNIWWTNSVGSKTL